MKDKCVMCGEKTAYDELDHIDYRYFYVEGAGQLCPECYNSTYQKKTERKSVCYLKSRILQSLNDAQSNRSQINLESYAARDLLADKIAEDLFVDK
jgi:recombinational DNA repair protein (RecF pathway)